MPISDHISRVKSSVRKISGYLAPDRPVSGKEAAYRRNQTLSNAAILGAGSAGAFIGGTKLRKAGFKKTSNAAFVLGAALSGAAGQQTYEHVKYRKQAKRARVGGFWAQEEMGMKKDTQPFGKNPIKNARLQFYRY